MKLKLTLHLICIYVFFVFSNVTGQTITTLAGNGCLGPESGDGGAATAACIGYPVSGSFDAAGNYYFAQDFGASKVRKIDIRGNITTVAGNGSSGFSGDGGPATAASLVWAYAIVNKRGDIFIADRDNYRVRKVDNTTGVITTIAGTGGRGHTGDGGLATNATLWPSSLCIDKNDNVYVVDSSTWIRKISTTGIISTIVGNGIEGFSGDGGLAVLSSIKATYGICIDTFDNLFIGDFSGRIRKVAATTGIITTIAGTGIRAPFLGDGIPATVSQFLPYTISIDNYGQIFISNFGVGNSRVLKIDTFGIIRTVAGTGVDGFSGDGGIATNAQIHNPEGVAIDACGNVYIADDANRRIRKVTYDTSCHLPGESLGMQVPPQVCIISLRKGFCSKLTFTM
jgi:hypothetical protein